MLNVSFSVCTSCASVDEMFEMRQYRNFRHIVFVIVLLEMKLIRFDKHQVEREIVGKLIEN